jgi:hypothetical protein
MALYDGLAWLRSNDLPNWFSLPFSLIAWPMALYWWSTHKRQAIPYFEVNPSPADTRIGAQQFDAVAFQFANRTGNVVYLSRARLRGRQKNFPIPVIAARDISGGWHQLKFMTCTGDLTEHECIVQANSSAITIIAVSRTMDQSFYSYQPGRVRRWFRCPKYFTLQYTAMVGEKKYSIESVY